MNGQLVEYLEYNQNIVHGIICDEEQKHSSSHSHSLSFVLGSNKDYVFTFSGNSPTRCSRRRSEQPQQQQPHHIVRAKPTTPPQHSPQQTTDSRGL